MCMWVCRAMCVYVCVSSMRCACLHHGTKLWYCSHMCMIWSTHMNALMLHTYSHTHVRTYIHTYTHPNTHTTHNTNTHTYMYTQTHIHTNTHAHTHTQRTMHATALIRGLIERVLRGQPNLRCLEFPSFFASGFIQ